MAVIKDVAKLAGLSVSVVSKYLNYPDTVSEDTKARVESAIKELGYVPSPVARSMRTKRSQMIAVVVPDIRDEFYADIFNNLKIFALSKGYTPILYTIENDRELLKEYLSKISMNYFDGIIGCFLDEDNLLEIYDVLKVDIPIVLMSGEAHSKKFSAVATDVEAGSYEATKHLIDRGYKRIGLINGPKANLTTNEKYSGFKRALVEAGLKVDEKLIFHGQYRYQTGYEAAKKYCAMREMPDAVFAGSDVIAAGLMKYMIERGVKIPEEMGVIGFDNIPFASIFEPGISSINIPTKKMCEELVNIMIDTIENGTKEKTTKIYKSKLVVRKSTNKYAPTGAIRH